MGNSEERSLKEKQIKKKNFDEIKKNLLKHTSEMNAIVNDIEDWDELLNIKEESSDEKPKIENSNRENYYQCELFFIHIFGFSFCILQLISVQSSIILIKAILNQIIEGILFHNLKKPRGNNFYEYIEISTYKEIPEIDVAMVTTTLGLFFHKKFGYYCSNITFHVIVSIILILFFLLFDFHLNDNLSKNYNPIELVVLCFIYIFLSIIVGCTSAIGLKEYYDLFQKYSRDKIPCLDKKNKFGILFCYSLVIPLLFPNDKNSMFYSHPGIALFITIIINRKIFISFSDKNSKLLLFIIVIIYICCIVLSNVFYWLYSKCLNKIKRNMEFEKSAENRKFANNIDKNKREEINKIIIYNENIEENKEIESRNDNLKIKLSTNNILSKSEDNIILNNQKKYFKIKKNIEESNKSSKDINILEEIKNIKIDKIFFDENSESYQERNKNINKLKNKNNKNYSTKVCTLCGYIYFQTTTENKNACIIYYYTGCKSWFCENFIKADVLFLYFLELLCQACNVGFKSILSDKLINIYSFSNIRNFFIALFTISLCYGIINIVFVYKICNSKIERYFITIAIYGFIFCYSIFITICSICYIKEDNHSRKRWDNITMASFIFFKCIDLQILLYFDFYSNDDIFNETLGITAEKVFWMLIETIIDYLEIKEKYLVITQIVFSPILIVYACYFYCLYLKLYINNFK